MLYHTDKTILFFNGEFKNVKDFRISPFNQTLHYGYGVFDGIRAYNTAQGPHLFKVRRHFDRLISSSAKLGILVPYLDDKDCSFCKDGDSMSIISMEEKDFCVIYPYEAHKPGGMSREFGKIKKAVFKIKI